MAIDEMLNEHEQSERVQQWLRSNALGLIGGVGLGLALIAGWNWWKGQQFQAGKQVSANFELASAAFEAGKIPQDKGRSVIAEIEKGNPTLGTLAALQLAKAQADSGKRDDAIATLRAVKKADADLQPVLQQRLARLLIDAGKAKDALPLLSDDHNAAMLGARGDAYFALGNLEKAQDAYRKALTLMDVADPQHQLTAMKMIEAGGTPPHSEGLR